MPKTIHDARYKVFLDALRKAREASGMRQEDVAAAMRVGQATISKIERGERRMDVIELRVYCRVVGTDLPEFVRRLERKLKSP